MIDHARLNELEADFGADELDLIIASFLEEAGEAIASLAAAGADPAARREPLHFIKGCARMVGAAELGDLCERLEHAPTFGADELRLLEAELRAARAEMEGSLARRTA